MSTWKHIHPHHTHMCIHPHHAHMCIHSYHTQQNHHVPGKPPRQPPSLRPTHHHETTTTPHHTQVHLHPPHPHLCPGSCLPPPPSPSPPPSPTNSWTPPLVFPLRQNEAGPLPPTHEGPPTNGAPCVLMGKMVCCKSGCPCTRQVPSTRQVPHTRQAPGKRCCYPQPITHHMRIMMMCMAMVHMVGNVM